MMKRELIKIFVVNLLLVAVLPLTGQVELSKTYEKIFYAKPGGKLEILNKYGEVIVRSWKEDSVWMKVNVRAEGKSREAVRKAMDKIDVRFRVFGDIVSAQTYVDQGSGLLKDLLSEVGDYSKSLFGGNKLTVDFEVWLPEDFDLSIENRFGDIYLSALKGRISLDLSHGDLKVNGAEQELTLKHSFGKSKIDYVHKGTFTLRGAEIRIDEGKMVTFESSSSELTLGKLDYLQFNSRNDKISVTQVSEILGEGTFTDLNADMIIQAARLNFTYGDIFITRIQKDFKSVDIIGKSTDINLILDQASYIKTRINAGKDKMIVPNSMLTLQKSEDEESGVVTLEGFVGPTQNKFGTLGVRMDGGELIVAIKELPLFTDKD